MSTKTTMFYIDTEIFKLHIYDDLAGSPAINIKLNNAETTLPISQEELQQIMKQIQKEKCICSTIQQVWDNEEDEIWEEEQE